MSALRQWRSPLAVIAFALMAAGVGLAAHPVAHAIIGQVSAAQAKAMWKKWKQSHAENSGKASAELGQPAFWLRVPSCKISVLVLRESDAEALHRFPAVRQLDSGGCVVLAHRDTHFHGLADVRVGDEIRVETADGSRAPYVVRSIRILLPEQVSAALDDPETRNSLHLLTCYPFTYFGAAPKRFLVTAAAGGVQPR